MLLEHIPVVQDSCRVGHVRHCIGSLNWHKLKSLVDVQISLIDIRKSFIIRNILQDLRIHEIRIVDVSADSYDVGIILSDESRLQDRHRIVGRTDL